MKKKHEIQSLVEQIYQTYHELENGAVADYIPKLSLANPEHFGMSILSANGNFFEYGDTNQLFTIINDSQLFFLAIAAIIILVSSSLVNAKIMLALPTLASSKID